jgi:hypothetical protein
LLDLASSEVRSLVPGIQARFAASGHVLYVTAGGTLHSMPFDQNRLSATGPAVPLLERVAVDVYNNVQAFAISDDGTLLHRLQSLNASELVWVTRSGAATPLAGEGWRGRFFSVALSPDGRQVAATLTTGTRQDIWTRSLDTGAMNRLTFDNDGSLNYRAKWTADGRALSYISNRSGTPGELWWQAADGSARAERLVADGPLIDEGLISPDALWAVYRAGGSDLISRDIKAMRLAGGADRTPIALVATRAEEYSPVLSTDGRWLAYVSEESSRPEVYVRPFPDVGAGVWQVSQGGGRVPVWTRRELFYQNLRGEMVAVRIKAGATFEWDLPEVLFDASDYEKNAWHPVYAVAPGGDRFLMVRPEPGSEGQLVLTLNWFREMTRALTAR